jgi:hypothetical protein
MTVGDLISLVFLLSGMLQTVNNALYNHVVNKIYKISDENKYAYLYFFQISQNAELLREKWMASWL